MMYRYWAVDQVYQPVNLPDMEKSQGLSQISIMRFFGRDSNTPWFKSTTVVYPQDFEMKD